MHHRAMRQITDVLGVCLNSTRTKEQWTCLRRDKHQELYAKRTGQGVSNGTSVYYLAVNEASCGFEEAFDLLHFDSTKQFRLMMKLLHGRDFKDGGLLSMRTREHSISDWTLDTQHAAVWFSYQDRRKSVLLREQHLTFFQTLKIFLPENQHDYQSAAASTSANSSMAGLSARPSDGVHKRTIALSWLPFPRSHEAMLETAQQVDLQYTLIVEEISPNRLQFDASDRTNQFDSIESDGYIGALPGRFVASVNSKIISIKSMARSTKNLWQTVPSTTSSMKSIWSVQALDSNSEREEEDLRRFDHRRTSLMSSNVGLLDQDFIADEGYFLPKLEDDREEERLKLLEVIVSPACTLVDRTLMHRSCEVAAAAFGVNAAFIARVDAEYVLIEHAPQNQPLVVLDCLADPRTREIPMVQHLRMHFFIGISVCVRGLPIACLCAFGQDDDNQSEEEYGNLTASFYDSGILENAARQMEDELESLVHGLELC
ncbi:hypothetical protein JG688_00002906 [Phytophthora aleatoria]|uniref:GAF domain-containing protein n=1 Tax=Phytophthora aleatoria TaxID=2496075 RepID=A0A8J5IU23_9STRA|nr:hypothetical protein JG688_00002906 [Phytophthora aleatoria]